jgi:hypothetical protein
VVETAMMMRPDGCKYVLLEIFRRYSYILKPMRSCALVLFAVLVAMSAGLAHGDEVRVPADLQVELLGRIVRYERSFAARTSETAHVMVVSRPRDAESQRVAAQLAAAITGSLELGGRRATVARSEFSSAAAMRAEVEQSGAAIVYLAPGLSHEMANIAAALAGIPVITVSAVGGDVDHGAVLGFELVSSRPQIAVNLGRATAQRLQFGAQFLRLARVVR